MNFTTERLDNLDRLMDEVIEVGEPLKYKINAMAIKELVQDMRDLEGAKNGAYKERDQLVCLLSKIFPAWLVRHPESDTTWEDDWRWIVFIKLPTGQASWHIHDSELEWFKHLEHRKVDEDWDGHTTEEKYVRVSDVPPLGRITIRDKIRDTVVNDGEPYERWRAERDNKRKKDKVERAAEFASTTKPGCYSSEFAFYEKPKFPTLGTADAGAESYHISTYTTSCRICAKVPAQCTCRDGFQPCSAPEAPVPF